MAYPDTIPLEGPFRLPLMFLEATIVYIVLHASLIFLKYYHDNKDTIKGSKLQLAWFWLTLGYAGTIFLYLFSDYFSMEEAQRNLLLNIAYLSEATGALFFFFNIEKLEIIRTRRFFSFLFGILYLVMVVLIVLGTTGILVQELIQYFSLSFLVPMIGLFLFYTFKVYKLLPRKLKNYTFLIFIPTFFISFGTVMAGDAFVEDYGLYSRVIGDLMQVTGIVCLTIYYLKMPTWRELEWKLKLKSIIVIGKGGVNVFTHHFKESQKDINPALVSSAIDIIRSLLGDLIPGELKVLDNKDTKILIERGDLITVAMIADEHLDSLDFLLHQFKVEFEGYFWTTLIDWDGEMGAFEPGRMVVEKVFL